MQSPPRIGFIARGLTENGGVKKFITSVLAEWNSKPLRSATLLVFTDEQAFVHQYTNLQVIYIPNHLKLLWDFLLFPKVARKYKLNTVIYTKNIIPFTHLLFHWKKLVVAYDLGYLYPELGAYKFWDTLYMKTMMGASFRWADKIMAISNFTKSEIIKFFDIDSKKIFVNYLGVSSDYKKISNPRELERVTKKYQLERPFIFYVGSLSPRKNILRTVQAFEKIKDKIPHMFYLISSRNWGATAVYEYIDTYLSDRVKIIEGVPEKDLIVIYNLADALIFPSLYEGFGLPIIEANACGCKVVTSDSTSCSEIGAFATLIQPTDEATIYEGILTVLSQRPHTDKKRSESKTYSWRSTALNLITYATNF